MTRTFAVAAVLALLTVVISRVSFAQIKVIQEADKTVFLKRQTVDYSNVVVEGRLQGAEGSHHLIKRTAGFESLIKVRTNFNHDLQKSVDNL